jgi:ABC-type antimicrobial peptide transport system permease subunit
VDQALAPSRFGSGIALALGLLALMLASVGMFGVFAYWVHERTPEIGVRMAIGARPSQVIRLVLGSSARAIGIGLACGLVGALLASPLLQHSLYGVSAFDPLAYASVILTIVATGMTAVFIPALRAIRVDPMTALRAE